MTEWRPLEDILSGLPPGDDYAPPGEAAAPGALAPKPLHSIAAASLAAHPVPPRRWIVDGFIPDRNVTLLAGDGGTGKSVLAMQLAASVATGRRWLGMTVAAGRSLYLACEDDADECHRRLDAIAGGRLDEFDNFHLVALAGHDAVFATTRGAQIAPTPLFESFRATVANLRPTLIVADTLADVFAGDEIARAHARQFVTLLRGVAIEHDCAVVVLAHPSLSGLARGDGASGSTAWANSVRSRLYLARPKVSEGEPVDPDMRTLTLNKSNYARTGAELLLRWHDGRFVRAEPGDAASAEARSEAADVAFLSCLRRFEREGRSVSSHRSPSYAPSQFLNQSETRGLRLPDLASAMQRLFASGAIRVEVTGSPSRQRSRIVESEPENAPSNGVSNGPENALQHSSDALPTPCSHTPPITPGPLEGPVGRRAPNGGVGSEVES